MALLAFKRGLEVWTLGKALIASSANSMLGRKTQGSSGQQDTKQVRHLGFAGSYHTFVQLHRTIAP